MRRLYKYIYLLERYSLFSKFRGLSAIRVLSFSKLVKTFYYWDFVSSRKLEEKQAKLERQLEVERKKLEEEQRKLEEEREALEVERSRVIAQEVVHC